MDTVGDLVRSGETALRERDPERASWLLGLALRAQPANLDARLRLADVLLAGGHPQEAASVYAAYAEHTARAGHPLRALVALLELQKLDPRLGELLDALAGLYGLGAPAVGRSARPSPGDPAQSLPDGIRSLAEASERPPKDRLVQEAVGLGRDVEGLTAYPDRLPPIPLFSLLPPEAFASVLRALTLVRVGPGEVILRQGAPGEAFYVIARGRVRVHREERGGGTTELATLYEGAIFGEMALLSASPRTATVTAEALDRFTRDRMVQNVLRSSPIFRPLDDAQRMDLFKRFTTHHLPAGAEVVTQGAPGAGLFLVLSGVVTVERQGADGGPTVALARLGAGELFGELSLLRNEPASATVRTATPAALLFLARAYVDRLVAAVPAIAAYVEGLAEQRLLDTEEALAADEIPIDVEI